MKVKLYTLVIGAIALTMLLVPIGTMAHYLGFDSVDTGQIRYGDETGYNNAISHSRSQWNSVGAINIAPDNADYYEDLTYKSTTRNDVTWAGLYTNTAGADEIYFNKKYMVPYGDRNEEIVGIHETGHALGLDHSYAGQVMAVYVGDMAHTPQSHDLYDYNRKW